MGGKTGVRDYLNIKTGLIYANKKCLPKFNPNMPLFQIIRIKPPMCVTAEDVNFTLNVLDIVLEQHSGKS